MKIIVAGAGGHAGMVIDTIRALRQYEVIGLVERKSNSERMAHELPILGSDDQLPALRARGIQAAANGVGSAKDNGPRRHVYTILRNAGFDLPPLVHPRAWVAENVVLGAGAQVMPGALILRSVFLGENVLVNSGAIVEHDSEIGAHTHICTGVRMGGQVTIGEAVFVGVGSSIRQGIRIGAEALIGAGSVVIEDVPDGAFVAGVPARRLRS